MQPGPAARRWPRALATAFCVYHVAAITLANVPENTAMGDALHRPFLPYLNTFALHQGWDMFTTIPHFLAMTGELAVLSDDGAETRAGPLLPGLAPYRNDNRLHVTFMRLAFSAAGYPGYPERYLAAVCDALTRRAGKPPKSVGFELRVLTLRSLADVRRDHRIAEAKTFPFGPAPCVR